MSEYHQFTNEDSRPCSPSLLQAVQPTPTNAIKSNLDHPKQCLGKHCSSSVPPLCHYWRPRRHKGGRSITKIDGKSCNRSHLLERSVDCPPPYFPPTDEGNAQYTWGDRPACNQSVTSMLPIDGPRPPPYIDNDTPPPFNLQDTENGHPTNNTPTNDTSVIIQQPNGTELPTVTSTPNDYLGWSICGCLCCVWSIGICAIISSCDSRRAANQGDTANAKSSSLCAFKLNVINMVLGVVLMTYCLLRFGLGV